MTAVPRCARLRDAAQVPKRVKPPKGEIYFRSEAPRGQLGYYLVSDGNINPYRVTVKSPCFTAMSVFHHLAKGMMIADVIACTSGLGTLETGRRGTTMPSSPTTGSGTGASARTGGTSMT